MEAPWFALTTPNAFKLFDGLIAGAVGSELTVPYSGRWFGAADVPELPIPPVSAVDGAGTTDDGCCWGTGAKGSVTIGDSMGPRRPRDGPPMDDGPGPCWAGPAGCAGGGPLVRPGIPVE